MATDCLVHASPRLKTQQQHHCDIAMIGSHLVSQAKEKLACGGGRESPCQALWLAGAKAVLGNPWQGILFK